MAQGLQYHTSVTATSSGGSVSFVVTGATDIVIKASRVTVINTGASDSVYINFTTTTGATTSDVPVSAGTSNAITIEARKGHFTGLSYTTTASAVPPFRVIAIAG